MQAIARWLAEVPEEAESLSVAIRDRETHGVDVLARWARPDSAEWSVLAGEWASKIESLLQDYASEVSGTTQASIRWLDGSANVVAQKRLKVRSDEEGQAFPQIEATTQAALGQVMQHQQVLMQTLTECVQYSVTEAAKSSETANAKLIELEVANRELARELAEVRAEMVEEAAAQTITEHTTRDPISERAEKLLEIVLMQWLKKQQGPKLPTE